MAILIRRESQPDPVDLIEFKAMVDIHRASKNRPLRFVNGIGRVALGIENTARQVAENTDLRFIRANGAHGDGLINIAENHVLFSIGNELEIYDLNGVHLNYWTLTPEVVLGVMEYTYGILLPLFVSAGLPGNAYYTADYRRPETLTVLQPAT